MTDKIYEKPFLTYDQQIDKLVDEYDLIIQDRNIAKRLLSSFSYYDLINGYKECFMEDNSYKRRVTIENLYTFLTFDRTFQSILLKYSIYVENRFKNILAYEISEKYGVDMPEYLDKSNFKSTKRSLDVLDNLNKIPTEKIVLNPTKHYLEKNHIPAWILLKNATFNDSIDLFINLKNENFSLVCKELFSNFDNLPRDYVNEFAINSLIIVRKFRNKIAHNLKFVTYRTPKNQLFVKKLSSAYGGSLIEGADFDVKRGRCDPYAMIISLTTLLNEDFLITRFFQELSGSIISLDLDSTGLGNDIFRKYCEVTNIPTNIINRFKHYIENLK